MEPLLTVTREQQPSAVLWPQAPVPNELSYVDFHSNQAVEPIIISAFNKVDHLTCKNNQ